MPETTGTAQISGKVVGPDGTALPGVLVMTSVKGKTIQTTTTSTGLFAINISDVERGQGFNLQFSKTNFENANQAAVISLPNLKVDIGNVTMFISGGSEVTSRKILGQVLDNFSYAPLAGANVTTIDSAGLAVVTTTDDAGKFALTSNYFALQSSFAVSVFKSSYISRTDLVAKITAEDNTIRNNPPRLYHKFGSIYAYVAEDSMGTPLNGVTVSLTNSNNQPMSCITGVGASPSGPYDALPLQPGAYCPDLAGLTSLLTNTAGDNNGGVKMQNDFLLLGTRYPVTLTKTSAACASRTNGTTGCYRTKSTYVDVALVGDNPISGGSTNLVWDAWIRGSVQIIDPPSTPGVHTICPGSAASTTTCAGNGVTVKLYDSSGTYITQTTTDASGNFLLDNSKILRAQVGAPSYQLTFERASAYSRLISYSNSPPLYQAAEVVVVSASGDNLAQTGGACTAGKVCMTALAPPTHCVMGTVKDYWSGQPVDGALVAINDGGWRTATTGTAAATGGFPALGNGQFIVQGNFGWPLARTGTLTTNSMAVTNVGSITGLTVGSLVSGTGGNIIPGTTITAISGSGPYTLTLSKEAQASGLDTLTFMPMFPVEISKPAGYTGEVLVSKQTFSIAHNGVAACPGAPYNIDTQPACSPTDVGPSGGAICPPKSVLYPIGLYAVINGSAKAFKYQIKQTYEKFLTEKTGLTISGRLDTLKLTSTSPQKAEDYDAFYLHLDDTPKILPNVPEGKWSNHVPVVAASTPALPTCSPTQFSPCISQANGVLAEGIGGDSRTEAWDIKNYVFYHFYAAAPGQYTVQTTGNTDTYITLIAQTGANLGSDDDSGSGSNAKIGPINLLRGWYYIKVKGKNDNVFGFFDVSVTGPTQSESNYNTMLSPSATYSTTCATNNGNVVLSWYDSTTHAVFIAAPGENGGCSGTATLEKHGPVGDIIRGRFGGSLRPISPTGSNAAVTNSGSTQGFYNIIRSE